MKAFAKALFTRILNNPVSTLAGLLLIAFAVLLYLLERIKWGNTMDSTIFIGMLTVGSGLVLAKDPKSNA